MTDTRIPEDPTELIDAWEQVSEIGLTQEQRRAYENCAAELEAWVNEHHETKRRRNATVTLADRLNLE